MMQPRVRQFAGRFPWRRQPLGAFLYLWPALDFLRYCLDLLFGSFFQDSLSFLYWICRTSAWLDTGVDVGMAQADVATKIAAVAAAMVLIIMFPRLVEPLWFGGQVWAVTPRPSSS